MTNTTLDELKEKLAAIEHERWADWQKWCHQVIRENDPNLQTENVLMRWDRQIETPYAELSEKEKQSDRDQVDRYLPLINLYIEERERLARLKGVEEVLLRLKQAPPIDWLDAQTWIDGEYERLQDRIKELEG